MSHCGCSQVVTSAALSCLGEYSHANNLAKRVVGLYLYATGAQRQSIHVLSTLGLSESYSNLITRNIYRKRNTSKHATKVSEPSATEPSSGVVHRTGTLLQLSESMREKTQEIAATGLFGVVYDNINIDLRNAEEIVGRHGASRHKSLLRCYLFHYFNDSQENGTCATVFPLHNAKEEDIKTEDLQTAFLNAPDLKLSDIIHTSEEAAIFKENIIFTILRIIIRFGGDGFKKFESDLKKNQPETKDKIKLHRTELYPLPPWHIDESTITGNAEVDQAIVKELNLESIAKFWKRVRFMGGDQLSLSRLRANENIRAGQEENYFSLFFFALIIGLFHAKIADVHGGLETHFGKSNTGARNPGSLSFHNTRLDRLPITLTSLPPFCVCRDLIFVSLYARVLHCLLLVSQCSSLDDYLIKHDSWDDLLSHVRQIEDKFANPSKVEELRWQRTRSQGKSTDGKTTEGDMVFENASLFLRDALISREYTDAVKAGDSGRVLLVLKVWALSFRGNGRTKYAYEMLHVIHNLTNVFPEPIR